MTNTEAIEIIKNYDALPCGICHQGGDEIIEAFDMAIKALSQEPTTLLEKTYTDFCECECGEGWLEIDGKEYFTDVGYAIEGMSIFMQVYKQRLAEVRDKE